MKINSSLGLFALAILGFIGMTAFTSKTPHPGKTSQKSKSSTTKPNDVYYDAQLVSTVQDGTNYVWTWTVTNPNPGDGSNGTMQNLSHWSQAISDVVTVNDITSVAYSTNGTNWVELPVKLAIDKSQDCYTGTVLKFNYGTQGTAPSYYRLIVNKYFSTGLTTANFKSGNFTGCYNGTVMGIGTPVSSSSR